MGSICQIMDKAKIEEVAGNGPRNVTRGCRGRPEIPVALKHGLQKVPGPRGAAKGKFLAKLTNRSTLVWGAPTKGGSAAWRSL